MKRSLIGTRTGVLGAVLLLTPYATVSSIAAEPQPVLVIPAEHEVAETVPMPAGFRVVPTEMNGSVFVNAAGKTLYVWPFKALRNGVTGDPKDKSACNDQKQTKTAGLMSPYPPGLDLPELDKRMTCTQAWAPEYAANDAKPVGAFTIITRDDGKKQWGYDGHALYTSYLDKLPGDVMAAIPFREAGDGPAEREAVIAPPQIPSGFTVVSTTMGRQIVTDREMSVYTSDHDGSMKSNCDAACKRVWIPVEAPALAQPIGDWSVIVTPGGGRQWALRKKPLYTYGPDTSFRSQEGTDVGGWHNAYTQKAPSPPAEFTYQDGIGGVVLADAKGRTIYTYICGDDATDQLACDQVDSPQEYRLAICGGGQVDRCLHDWPYVVASPSAKSLSRTWQVLEINPQTGHLAKAGEPSLRVWAYLGKPIFTNVRDTDTGDIAGNANGEFGGNRNGFHAFFVRPEFQR